MKLKMTKFLLIQIEERTKCIKSMVQNSLIFKNFIFLKEFET